MTPAEQAAAHDANFVETFRLIARLTAGGWAATVGGVPVAVTGVPIAFFNAAWPSPMTSRAELSVAVANLRETGLPFVVHVPADAPDLSRAALDEGLTLEGRLPCFAIGPRPIPAPPRSLRIERVDAASLPAFRIATAAGFGMPEALVEQVYPARLVDEPSMRAYIGWLDDRPVATSAATRTGSTVGIYSVATVPAERGRGIGSAMTWHVLRDADPGWAVGVLQASPMGRPIYERMGFALVQEFDEFGGDARG